MYKENEIYHDGDLHESGENKRKKRTGLLASIDTHVFYLILPPQTNVTNIYYFISLKSGMKIVYYQTVIIPDNCQQKNTVTRINIANNFQFNKECTYYGF